MNESFVDVERRKAIERANAHREMQAMWAWKDVMAMIAHIKAESVKSMDDIDIRDLTVAYVAEARGVRKGFERLEAEIEFILGDVK